jgi:hypothetical protein
MNAFPLSRRPGVASSMFLAGFIFLLCLGFLSGCSTGMQVQPPGNTQVAMLLTSSANDQLASFYASIAKITLTSTAGTVVTLYDNPAALNNPFAVTEWMHLNGSAEPLVSVSVPQGTYPAATVQIGSCSFTNVIFGGGSLNFATYAEGVCSQGTNTSTVSLITPITITGTSMALLLDLQVSQSYTLNSAVNPATYTISPLFDLSPVTVIPLPKNVLNGKVSGINAQITGVNAQSNTFTVETPDGFSLTFSSSANTVYQGIAGLSALSTGVLVNLDAAIQPSGAFLATRVEVDDLAAPALLSGPNQIGPNSQTGQFQTLLYEREGCSLVGNPFCGTLLQFQGTTTFAISGEYSNLQTLPFVPTFDGNSLFQGQNVSAYTAGTLGTQGSQIVTAVTLLPQTLNGTVSAISNQNGFTVYTLTLASYDSFPVLQMYGGPYPHISSPSSVTVYVDSNTALLNHGAINMGSLLRVRGLVFDDNGTIRMDCGQIFDGIPE